MTGYVEIPLPQGFVAMVDLEDYDHVMAGGSWRVSTGRWSTRYAMRHIKRADGKRSTQQMHTLLTGWPLVDHIDGNGLDNRRSNLRPATNAENQRNRGPNRNNSSGFKGVSWQKGKQKWQAGIVVDGRRHFLGYHATAEEAALAYDIAALESFGEFAWLNFPAVALGRDAS